MNGRMTTKKYGQNKQLLLALVSLTVSLGCTGKSLAGATVLALRSESPGTCIHNGSTAQLIETVFGNNPQTLPFTGTATYDFYSPPLTVDIVLTTKDKGSGTVYMENTSTSDTNDFTVTSHLEFLDYDPATGANSLIVEATDASPTGVKHGQLIKWSQATESLVSNKTVPRGHLLHLVLTIALVSGDPGSFGHLVYNGSSGATTVGLLPANDSIIWPFGPLCSAPDATITTSSSVVANTGGNIASVAATPGGSYVWTINNGTITAGQGANQITWTAGAAGSADLGVTVTTAYSSSSTATVIVTPASSAAVNLIISASANPILTGSEVDFAVTVAPVSPGAGTPTGTVVFLADGSPLTGPLVLSNGVASFGTSSLSHGEHTITAQYSGDGNFSPSTSSLGLAQVVNASPVVISDGSLSVTQNLSGSLSAAQLLQNVADPDGDPLSLMSVSSASAHGGIVSLTNGIVTYQPPPGYTGEDSFAYSISDPFGGTATATLKIAVGVGLGQIIVSIDQLPDRNVLLTCAGVSGQPYLVQATFDLASPVWTTLSTTNAGADGLFWFIDLDATNYPSRFYRTSTP